jgi:ribonuclease D
VGKIHLHQYDLPELEYSGFAAVDTEAEGLITRRDRLCLVQVSTGDGDAHLVQFPNFEYSKAHNLKKLCADSSIQKVFHFARFDVAIIKYYLEAETNNVFCTKIASRLARTYTEHHSYKTLVKELLGMDLSKEQQASNWARLDLTAEQQKYAANDVFHLLKVRDILANMLDEKGRTKEARACFDFLQARCQLDIDGFDTLDIFAH